MALLRRTFGIKSNPAPRVEGTVTLADLHESPQSDAERAAHHVEDVVKAQREGDDILGRDLVTRDGKYGTQQTDADDTAWKLVRARQRVGSPT
jgi:hypothetical protein